MLCDVFYTPRKDGPPYCLFSLRYDVLLHSLCVSMANTDSVAPSERMHRRERKRMESKALRKSLLVSVLFVRAVVSGSHPHSTLSETLSPLPFMFLGV